MKKDTQPRHPANEVTELGVWLGSALAIGRGHLSLSLKDDCRDLAGVSDKTLMKWESGNRLHPLAYAIALARRDEVTRSMLLQTLSKDTSQS